MIKYDKWKCHFHNMKLKLPQSLDLFNQLYLLYYKRNLLYLYRTLKCQPTKVTGNTNWTPRGPGSGLFWLLHAYPHVYYFKVQATSSWTPKGTQMSQITLYPKDCVSVTCTILKLHFLTTVSVATRLVANARSPLSSSKVCLQRTNGWTSSHPLDSTCI